MKNTYSFMIVGLFLISSSLFLVGENSLKAAENMSVGGQIFIAKLEKVDTGCFADGECFVEVGGKHVTVLIGWSRDVVGQVLGVESFGDLEKHIGKNVEVYARMLSDGKYTLYGNQGYYVKVVKN
ncbi:MAG: hypothetical protein WAX44_00530 [Minisyncoccia bacterium]